MNGLTEFQLTVAEIIEDYQNDEMGMTYEMSNTRMEIAIDTFSVANAINMPDEAMDEIFAAFADLHLVAFDNQHLSEAEACQIIHTRAKDMFETSRGWEYVEAVTQPYVDIIEGNDEPPAQQWDMQQGPTFKGPFGQDIGLN